MLPTTKFSVMSLLAGTGTQASEMSLSLTWDAIPGAARYEVSGSNIETRMSTYRFTSISGIQPEIQTFSVKALDEDGNTISQLLTSEPKTIGLFDPYIDLTKTNTTPPAPGADGRALYPVRLHWSSSTSFVPVSYKLYKDGAFLLETTASECVTAIKTGERCRGCALQCLCQQRALHNN